MDWNEVGKIALVAGSAVAPAVSVATLILKIRESTSRTRAHSIAVESYALAKSIGELGRGDAGSAHAPYLRNELLRSGNEAARRYQRLTRLKRRMIRNWVDALVYSVMCLLFGAALLQFPEAFDVVDGTWALCLHILGGFFVALGAYVFITLVVVVGRRRKALCRLLKQSWLSRRQRAGWLNRIDEPESTGAL